MKWTKAVSVKRRSRYISSRVPEREGLRNNYVYWYSLFLIFRQNFASKVLPLSFCLLLAYVTENGTCIFFQQNFRFANVMFNNSFVWVLGNYVAESRLRIISSLSIVIKLSKPLGKLFRKFRCKTKENSSYTCQFQSSSRTEFKTKITTIVQFTMLNLTAIFRDICIENPW